MQTLFSRTSVSVSVLDSNDNTCNAKHIHENMRKENLPEDTCTDTHTFALTHCLGRAKVISRHRDGPSIMIIDSGATSHMNPDYNAFIKYNLLPPGHYVELADKSKVPVMGISMTLQQLWNRHVALTKVLHVPQLHSPLLSIQSFHWCQGCAFIATYVAWPSHALSLRLMMKQIASFHIKLLAMVHCLTWTPLTMRSYLPLFLKC